MGKKHEPSSARQCQRDGVTPPTDLTVQLVGADAKPRGGGLGFSVGSSISSQQVQSPQGVNVEVLLQPQSSFQHADGVGCLLLQLKGKLLLLHSIKVV